MKRKTKIKIARGRLEEERRKSEDRFEYQRVMLFVLPLIMVAVLVIGTYFGYLSYKKSHTAPSSAPTTVVATDTNALSEEDQTYLLTIVNSASPADSDFVPALSDYNGVKVSSLMLNDLTAMMNKAKENKLSISVKSGYISYEEQKKTYDAAVKEHKKKNKSSTVKAEAAVKKTIPNAGESEQQTGLLIELTNSSEDFSKTKEYDWLVKNCVNYGFVLRYPDKENTGGLSFSPNMFRYVGVENALQMRSYDMNLDEFVQYLGVQ